MSQDPLFELAHDVLGEPVPEHPPLITDDGRVRLSATSVAAFRDCPRRFRHAFVERLPTRPSRAASYGISVHAALEQHARPRLPLDGEDTAPSVEDLLAALYAGWDRRGFVGHPREVEEAWYRDAQAVLRLWHARQPRPFRPAIAVEQRFEVPLGDDVLLVGVVDRVDADDDGTLHLVDYKTGRLRTSDHVRRSLQLALYALACRHLWGRLPADVALDFVRAGVVVRVPVDELDLDAATATVVAVADEVRAGIDRPEPSYACRWCDWRSACPAWEGDGPELLGPAVAEARALRASVAADLERLRGLDAGVARLRAELEDRPADTDPDSDAPAP